MIKEQKTDSKKALACRNALTEPERERGKLLITERILGHQWYYLSDTILGFVSYGSEICTTEILESALQDGKSVYVPKVEDGKMEFYRMFSLSRVEKTVTRKSRNRQGIRTGICLNRSMQETKPYF